MATGEHAERLTHVGEGGEARMVDVGDKAVTRRVARAGARVWMAPNTMNLLLEQAFPKGDVLAVARVAGIMAAKRTSELVPLCHPLPLDLVDIRFTVREADAVVDIECETRTEGRTGVEMEAITGAAVAAITIYDMCKAVDRGMVLGDIRLLEKAGGRHDYRRPEGAVRPEAGEGDDPGLSASQAGGPPVLPRSSGSVVSVNISAGKGERKRPADGVVLEENLGIVGDGHAGSWHRQVSLLAQESIDTMRAKGLDVGPGAFAENITTLGIDLPVLPVGTVLAVGETLLEVTQIGKVCHDRCAIYRQAGDCVMPREGIFARVLRGGRVGPGDVVTVAGATGEAKESGR